MPHTDFVHLNCHTQFSLLDSACRVSDLLKRAVELKFPALAMTDNGNLFGAIEFDTQAMKYGIKPIIGMDAYIAPGSRLEKQAQGIKEASFRLTLLARNEEGYRNLIKLASIGYIEGFYYRPRIDKEVLAQLSGGLIAMTGGLRGEVPYYIRNDQNDEVRRVLGEYFDIFGKENLYLEMMDHGLEPQRKINQACLELSKELGLKIDATNDVHYIYRENAAAHDALICIGTGSMLDQPN